VQTILPDSEFSIRINGVMPKLSPDLENEVDRLWLIEQKKRGKSLFNGSIMSAHTVSEAGIDGYIVEYRYLIAQLAQPDLFSVLQVRPVAVSGLFECADGIVFGCRAGTLTQDAGLWELVPSGGIDASKIKYDKIQQTTVNVDFISQILTELHQEIGVKSAFISSINPFCLVDDTDSHVLDIGIAIESPLSYHEILMAHRGIATKEYENLRLIPRSEIGRYIKDEVSQLIGVSTVLIKCFENQHLNKK
jgi:hypothetical protein